MIIWGKVFGAFCGLLIGLKMGLYSTLFSVLLGLYLGDLFDRGLKKAGRVFSFLSLGHQVRRAFFSVTFSMMGYIAKSDGRVSEDEIKQAEIIMERLGLTSGQRQDAISLFNSGKEAGFPWQQQLQALAKVCRGHHDILQIFIEIQIESAYADGALNHSKRGLLLAVATTLDFSHKDFDRLERMFLASQRFQQRGYQYQHYYQQQNQQVPPQNHKSVLQDAYEVLGIKKEASDSEVKIAYRRLMSQHHPDKLVSKGLPEAMIKVANEKTQKIKEAYERIMAARQ